MKTKNLRVYLPSNDEELNKVPHGSLVELSPLGLAVFISYSPRVSKFTQRDTSTTGARIISSYNQKYSSEGRIILKECTQKIVDQNRAEDKTEFSRLDKILRGNLM